MSKMVIIKDIPIVATGIEYNLASGPATFTEQDLVDAIQAANDDPTLRTPRLKLGHVEEGWNANNADQGGEPAFGKFINLRLSANRQEIIADLETFDWLAEILPLAWPNRSIEGYQGAEAPSGKRYGLVIQHVAALGIEWPGVGSLEDLQAAMDNPEVIVMPVAAAGRPKVVVRAQVDVDIVRRQFYAQVTAEGSDRYWWWIRSMRVEPNEVIAQDDDSGDLYRVPFTVNGNEVAFGEPVRVYEQFVDAPAGEQEKVAAAGMVLASWGTAASSRENIEEVKMDREKMLRLGLGLPEDATDEQVQAELTKRATANGGEEGQPTETDGGTTKQDGEDVSHDVEKPATTTTTVTETRDLALASSGVVQVDAQALEQLRRDAAMGRQARESQINAERDAEITAAIKAGKFAPARREHFRKLMDADPEGTRAMIAGLAENVIPVNEVGDGRGGAEDTVASSIPDAYPLEWLTDEERARIAAARGGS